MTTHTVAIIGTAGRGSDEQRLSAAVFERMCTDARKTITETWKLDASKVHLVSGGSAWSDHAAIALWNAADTSWAGLTLHLPAKWDAAKCTFADTGVVDWRNNPGGTLNYYHRKFGNAIKRDSLRELETARLRPNARFVEHVGGAGGAGGMFVRNDHVAQQATHMIAFTFGLGALPKADSGTMYTWKRAASKTRKLHISLL